MRTIRFRGKDALTGAWVYGYYATLHVARKDNHDALLGYDEIPSIFNDEPGERSKGGYWHSVKPETVGQFTGLKDKNGVEIYEGDVVNRYESIYGGRIVVGIIKYAQETCQFVFLEDYKYAKNEPLALIGKRQWGKDWYEVEYQYEVIGNIHDNPELINKE